MAIAHLFKPISSPGPFAGLVSPPPSDLGDAMLATLIDLIDFDLPREIDIDLHISVRR